MGYDVNLVPKTRNENILSKIYDCKNKQERSFLTRNFAMFQSRNFENCELEQVEKLLDIDLSVYTKYPVNFVFESDELEYRLFKAEENKNKREIIRIKEEIEEERKKWEESYDQINDGWARISEFKKVTEDFIDRMKQKPDFGEKIVPPINWKYDWDSYFSLTPRTNRSNTRLIDDLKIVLNQLVCIKEQGIEYVALLWSIIKN